MSHHTSTLIEARNLKRVFKIPLTQRGLWGSLKGLFYRKTREVHAVERLDFSIGEGEAVGFIGPNGAGKSTTVKMLTGILTPSAGELEVCGLKPSEQRKILAQKIGVVFGQRTQLWWDLPVIESFSLLRHIYRVSNKDYNKRLDHLVSLLNIQAFLDIPVRKLSLGQRMRADLVASLLHDPPVLFLDEPTIGLDVEVKDAIRNFLKFLIREKNKTLLLTTHDLKDIEILCPRLIIIDEGKLLFDGALEQLREKYFEHVQITLELDNAAAVQKKLDPAITSKIDDSGRLIVNLPRKFQKTSEFISWVLAESSLHEIRIDEPEIEDVIRQIYQGKTLK
jgi:ABC-2 type transport system ATP-binding protein